MTQRSEAEIIIVAASRRQADQLRRQADQMVRRSGRKVPRPRSEGVKGYEIDGCLFEVKAGYREIRLDDARMVVLAADADTADGAIPTLALVDELHRHRSMELYEILRKGLSAPPPAGRRGSLKDFERFCGLLKLDTGKPMELEPHERKVLRLYFEGYRETVVIVSGKNGKTTLLAALGLYHLKMGSPIRQMITISTAGVDEESPLGRLRAKAHAMPSFRRRGKLNTVKAADKSFAWLEWCLDASDDRTDIELVKKVNPASWRTIEALRMDYQSPSMTEGFWARIHCGVWSIRDEPFVDPLAWDRLAVDIGAVEDGEEIDAAIVVGTNPAIAIAARRPGEPEDETGAAVKVWIGEGAPDLEALEAEVMRIAQTYDVGRITYAKSQFLRSALLLEKKGLPMKEEPHSPERLSIVTHTLYRMIQVGNLHHDGDPVLRSQVVNAATKETEDKWRLKVSDASRGVVAMALAAHLSTLPRPTKSKPMVLVGRRN